MKRLRATAALAFALLLRVPAEPAELARVVLPAAAPLAASASGAAVPLTLTLAPLAAMPAPAPILSVAAPLPIPAAPAIEGQAFNLVNNSAPKRVSEGQAFDFVEKSAAKRDKREDLNEIKSLTLSGAQAGLAFDGARQAAPLGGPAFDASDIAPAASPALAPSSAPREKKPLRGSLPGRFLQAAAAGTAAAAFLPFLWHAVPAASALAHFAVAVLPVVAAGAAWGGVQALLAIYRRLFADRAPRGPSRRAAVAARALGVAVGVALTAATFHYERPMLEHVYAAADARLSADRVAFQTPLKGVAFVQELRRELSETPEGRAALEKVKGAPLTVVVAERRTRTTALPGTFFADSTVALLYKTASGRAVLDGLRDRGGVVRMPIFFVSYQEGSSAKYTPPDAVFLSVETIERGGVTVERFLNDRQAQLDYLVANQATLVHELEHADQARRSPLNHDTRHFLEVNASRLWAAVKAYTAPVPPPSAHSESAPVPVPVAAAPAETPAASKPAALPIVLDGAELNRAGYTVEAFANDRAAQKEYVAKHLAELTRALRPAPEAPVASPKPFVYVPPKAADLVAAAPPRRAFEVSFGMVQEWEYEAYLTAHFYTHERLKTDPAGPIPDQELAEYRRDLVEFGDFLAAVDASPIYAGNFHGGSKYDREFLAAARATWDARRVEAHILLARRAEALGHPREAAAQMEQARQLAAEKRLPLPDSPLPR